MCKFISNYFYFKEFQQFQVSQAAGQPIFNQSVAPHMMQTYHQTPQMQTVQSQTYQPIRMYHEAQQQTHIAPYLVPTPPSTTPSPGQPHQQAFHPGQQPSPAGGTPAPAFPPSGQYVMFMPSNVPPPFLYSNQPNPQTLHVVLPQQQQHQQQ